MSRRTDTDVDTHDDGPGLIAATLAGLPYAVALWTLVFSLLLAVFP